MSSGRESTTSRWPELATIRALAQQLQLPRGGDGGVSSAGRQLPAGRRGGREDHAGGKTAKVMHLLLWGPK